MKFKFFALLMVTIGLSSCGSLDGLFEDEFVGRDSTFSDSTFKEIPTHDSIDCAGSCTVKIYNR